jgi:2-methylcitrate dehydratase PrpD
VLEAEASLYDALASLPYAELPQSAVESCQAAILDHFGCAVQGADLPWTTSLVQVLTLTGDMKPVEHGGSPVYGLRELISPLTAALINGTATHAMDLDDTHLPTMTHPGCVVIPAAVAAAVHAGARGHDLIAGVICGYEVMGRVAAATGLGFGERGFHATGQVGPMAAAAACSRVLGADRKGFASAIGLAASFGGGIKAFSTGNGAVKRLHAGRAAQAGLLAALLEAGGFNGPPAAITGKFGFVPTLSTDADPAYEQLAGSGRAFLVEDVYLKPYAACGAVHGAIAAASQLATVAPGSVARVEVGTSRRALQQNDIPEPEGAVAAQYSTQYAVALALTGVADDPRRFLPDVVVGDDVRRLCGRTALVLDEVAEAAYPDRNEARVRVWLNDGTCRSAYGTVSAQTSGGWAVAEKKFGSVTTGLLSQEQQQRLLDAVGALADDGPVEACLDALTDAASSAPGSETDRSHEP